MRTFLLVAIACVAGCERPDTPEPKPVPIVVKPVAPPVLLPAPTPPAAMVAQHPEPAPPPEPVPVAPPPPVHRDAPPTPRAKLYRWFHALERDQRKAVQMVCDFGSEHPCGRMLQPDLDDPTEAILADVGFERDDPKPFEYCNEFQHATCNTPLVVAFADEPVAFAAHWPTAATPWIALDRDGDGAITDASELFGSATARDGFAALAQLDANGDGVIDRRDPAFARLLLWADANGDHRSTPDELTPLSTRLSVLPLVSRRDPRCTADDDCEGERASLPGGGAVVDVYLPVPLASMIVR